MGILLESETNLNLCYFLALISTCIQLSKTTSAMDLGSAVIQKSAICPTYPAEEEGTEQRWKNRALGIYDVTVKLLLDRTLCQKAPTQRYGSMY